MKKSDKIFLPRVVIFGAGRSGQNYLRASSGIIEVVAVVDNDPNLWGTGFAGHIVVGPARIPSLSFDFVAVTTSWAKEVFRQLVDTLCVLDEDILVPPKEATAGPALKNPSLRRSIEHTLAEVLEIKHAGSSLFMPTYGTLLGIVRDGGLIPWDTDIDLMVFESDLEVVEQLIGDTSFSEMIGQVLTPFHDRASDGTLKRFSIEISVSAVTVPVDIDIIRGKADKMEFFSPFEREKIMVVERSLFEPKRSLDWAGAVVAVPNRVEEFLQLLYGRDWKTPDRGWTVLDHFDQKMFE